VTGFVVVGVRFALSPFCVVRRSNASSSTA